MSVPPTPNPQTPHPCSEKSKQPPQLMHLNLILCVSMGCIVGIYTIQMWRFARLHIWIVQIPPPQLVPNIRGCVCVGRPCMLWDVYRGMGVCVCVWYARVGRFDDWFW